jgi:hypothetical protein
MRLADTELGSIMDDIGWLFVLAALLNEQMRGSCISKWSQPRTLLDSIVSLSRDVPSLSPFSGLPPDKREFAAIVNICLYDA